MAFEYIFRLVSFYFPRFVSSIVKCHADVGLERLSLLPVLVSEIRVPGPGMATENTPRPFSVSQSRNVKGVRGPIIFFETIMEVLFILFWGGGG